MINCNDIDVEGKSEADLLLQKDITTEGLQKNRYYSEATFLCPNTTELVVQGQTDSEMFSYVEIAILGCDLPEGECADISEVENTYLTFYAL